MPSPFIVEERQIQGPATHAIVIGVGRYPHLPGGGGPQVGEAERMGQLTSPPVSARQFATWLIENLHHPDKPLADVFLLLSEARPKPFRNPKTGVEITVEVPTIENLRKALQEWRACGDAGPGQRLIFYFCGHGMGKGSDTALLAADYGADRGDPLDAAIDFRNFLAGMSLSAADDQVYFVDACRIHSGSLLKAGGYSGRPIFRPDLAAPPNPNLRAPVFYATLAGAAAYGRDRKPSIFTEALLHGLDGAGAVDDEGDWRVTAMRLKEALDFHLERALKRLGRAQVPATDNAVKIELHRLKGDPNGTAIIVCDSDDATAAATFSYASGGRVEQRPRARRGEWVVELPAGSYEFRADFGRAKWRAAPETVYVRPVYKKVRIEAIR